jgi:hypothetical protein
MAYGVGRWAGAVLVALLAMTAGCTDEPIEPADLDSGGGRPGTSPSARPAAPTAAPTGSTGTAAGIDVCARVPADAVRVILGTGKVDQIVEPSPTTTVEPPNGAPPMPTTYRCAYRVGTSRVQLSVLPDSGAGTPQAAVDTVLGQPNTAVPAVGDAAAIDRSGRLGNGFAFLAAAERTNERVGAVLVRAPATTPDDKLVALAKQLLAVL